MPRRCSPRPAATWKSSMICVPRLLSRSAWHRPPGFTTPCITPPQGLGALSAAFSVGMMLSPKQSEHSIAALKIETAILCAGQINIMADAGMEILRCGNPAARALPLLAAIARHQSAIVTLEYLDGNCLQVGVTPCI